MARCFLHFTLVILVVLSFTPCLSQPRLWHKTISRAFVDVRGAPVVLAQQDIAVSEPGIILVQFNGMCLATVGDVILLAASNTPTWGYGSGHVPIKVPNSDNNRKSFSHTRSYSVSAGAHSFYAVAENFLELKGLEEPTSTAR